MLKLLVTLSILVNLFAPLPAAAQTPPARKPAILFCCPGENRYAWAGYEYMRDLQQQGFEVDYIEGQAALTWDKAKNYNVLFVYGFPAVSAGADAEAALFDMKPPYQAEYFAVIDRFIKAGGGVYLQYESRFGAPDDLLKQWGIQLPIAYIHDLQEVSMTNLSRGGTCAYTNQILPSPISQGVRGLWYPIERHYIGGHTMPIIVDDNWKAVVKASKTAYTDIPVIVPSDGRAMQGSTIPQAPIKEPALLAIREFVGGGRMAAIQQWHQFNVGSGMKWLYNSEVMSKGLQGKPSDYARLLANSFRWLAEPSLNSTTLGGFVTDPVRLFEPQLKPKAMDAFHEWKYDDDDVHEYHRPPSSGKIFRGFIGAQTAYGTGQGTVADYAKAAAELNLDYVVFTDDLEALTPAKLDALKRDVAANSTPTLKLYAGYRMHANTGNDMFVYGNDPKWPTEILLVGPSKKTFTLQFQDSTGKFVQGNPQLGWLLENANHGNTVGYYNFRKAPNGLRMSDLRLYSQAALRYYAGGKLIEDVTPDYLTTAQSGAVATPISLDIVRSSAEMRQAVSRNDSLTYGKARSLATLWQDALRWNNSYDGMNVFVSDGPIIDAWPQNLRVMTFGNEPFVSSRSVIPSPIHVTSSAGLKEIRIYDGRELFRRFVCGGVKEYSATLFVPGTTQRNMVMVAEDINGARATSFPYRNYKEGPICSVFCSDHVNDCAYMLLAHGSHWPMFQMVPTVPDAGQTWDGGPLANRPLISGEFTSPSVSTSAGSYGSTPYQTPLVEFADEGAARNRMETDRLLDPAVPPGNAWSGFGPLIPNPLFDAWASHTFFDPYVTGVDPYGYGAPGLFDGPIEGLFTERITFKTAVTLQSVRLFNAGWRTKTYPRTLLVVGEGRAIKNVLDLTEAPAIAKQFHLATGDWFGLYSGVPSNSHLFINRGAPALLQANPNGAYWLEIYADAAPKDVKPGDSVDAEFFSMVWPMSGKPGDAAAIAEAVSYLDSPTGMQLTRGKRGPRIGGLLELATDDGAVELSIPKSKSLPMIVPLRVAGLNKRWSTGLYQVDGYRTHTYSPGNAGWRALGLDFAGSAYAPLYVSMADNTHVLIGHPIVADAAGSELFIQATRVNDGSATASPLWHISVNNPTDRVITTTLKKAMDVPGLTFATATVTLQPGEYKVLSR
ncbi:MAG TPA: hypothetical protein VGK19_17720 [Capsulimonadaceae bacterium]